MSGGLFDVVKKAAEGVRDTAYRAAGGNNTEQRDGHDEGSFAAIRDSLYEAAGGKVPDDEVTVKVKTIVADILAIELDRDLSPEQLSLDDSLMDDLRADMEEVVNVEIVLETEFGIELGDEDPMDTVADIIASVRRRLGAGTAAT